MRNFVKPLKSNEICAPPSPKKGNTVPFYDYWSFFSSVPVACILYNAHRLHYEEVVRVEFSVWDIEYWSKMWVLHTYIHKTGYLVSDIDVWFCEYSK
jgi:hypothetical protein